MVRLFAIQIHSNEVAPFPSVIGPGSKQKCYPFCVNSNEFKRWLAKQGATVQTAKGSHIKVSLNGRQSVLPMQPAELKTGTVEGIKKQLGLKRK